MVKRFRACTQEQVSRGSSLDIRVDRICQDLLDNWNNIRQRHRQGLLIPQPFVLGWTPLQGENMTEEEWLGTGIDHHMPWMAVYNSIAGSLGPVASMQFLNPWRHKGHRAQWILSEDHDLTTARQWAWTSAFASNYPLIIDNLTLWLATDLGSAAASVLANDFQWDAGSPYPPNDADDYVRDWNIVLMADHPFSLEDRSHSTLVASLWERGADCCFWSSEAQTLPDQDMQPFHQNYAGNWYHPLGGICARMQNLGISMPAGARWRVGVFLPQYDEDNYASPWQGDATYQQEEWRWMSFQRYSLNVWALQEVV